MPKSTKTTSPEISIEPRRIATEVSHNQTRAHLGLLDEEIDRLQQTVGPARFRVRFPSPNQRDLLR